MASNDTLYRRILGAAWHGVWAIVLSGILIAEIYFTMADFVVEITVRKPLGDVYGGERITHALMGIIYGAMLAFLIPVLLEWWSRPTALVAASPADIGALGWAVLIMAGGVLLSGARDLYAALGLPYGDWPWRA